MRPLADLSATFIAWGASGISFSNIAAILIKKNQDGGRAQGKRLHHVDVEKYLQITLPFFVTISFSSIYLSSMCKAPPPAPPPFCG